MAFSYSGMSVCVTKPGSPSAASGLTDGRFALKQAICRPGLPDISPSLASCRLDIMTPSFLNINLPCASARKTISHPAFAFNSEEFKPLSFENLEAKNDAESEDKPFSELDVIANTSSKQEMSTAEQRVSEYKPFNIGELEQNVTRNTKYKPYKQKHKTVSTTFQPLGPGYPPITLEELEADLAKSNYKPFSRFESNSDVTSNKPLGSEYKPFTIEELEQRTGESTYKPISRQGGKSFPSFNQALDSQYKPFTVQELVQGSTESSYDSSSSQGSKPPYSEIKPVETSFKHISVEDTEDNIDNASANDVAVLSSGTEASASTEESAVISGSEIAELEPPKLTKLYAGNFPWDYDNKQLEELFNEHGSVFVAEMITDKVTGRSRGFGFVYMNSPEDAEVAIRNLDGKEIRGRRIRVNYHETAEERYNRVARLGGGGGGGGVFGYGEGNNNANKLFVANLPWNVDDEALGRLFSDFTVVESRIAYDRATGRSRGFGFVTLSSADELTTAIAALDGSDYEGRMLKVALAVQKPAARSSIF